MNSKRHELMTSLFEEASEVPESERDAFLEEATRGDAELLDTLRRLLRHDDGGPGALDQPIVPALDAAVDAAIEAAEEGAGESQRLPLPDAIGPYRILGVLGRGGMGIVYEAEQETPARQVALKVLRPDVATREMMRRFEHETLMLGRLNHPGIAQVYDAGSAVTEAGRQPFLAMELVRGVTLTRHAEENNLSREERLELLVAVADAVHHAHQRGVVHRDLKPANVMVDVDGNVKVLDFGVATTIDVDAHLTTMHTAVGEVMGTLSYMSPEQVNGRSSEVDARTDVYALGVLAHELFTGEPPFNLRGKLIHEAARIVTEEDPSTLGGHDESLRGDVEWIVAKALEKDATRRYASAEALAADVRRHLAHQPITAGAPGAWYLATKFARRHRAFVSGLAATLLTLTAGLITSTVLFLDSRERRIELAAALEEAEAVTDFVEGILKAGSPAFEDKDLTVRELLQRSAPQIDDAFADSPRAASRLHHTVAAAFETLGATDLMLTHARRSLDVRRTDERCDPALLKESELLLGDLLSVAGKTDEAGAVLTDGLESAEGNEMRARFLIQLAKNDKNKGDMVGSRERLDEVFELVEAGGVSERVRINALTKLAIAMARTGQLAEARPRFEEVLAWNLQEHNEDHVAVLDARYNLATILSMMGHAEEVLEIDLAVLASRRRILGDEHPSTSHSFLGVGAGLIELGRAVEAEPYLVQAVEGNEKSLGAEHLETLNARGALGKCLRVQGRLEEADAEYKDAIATATEALEPAHWVTLLMINGHALVRRELGDLDGAIQLHRYVVEESIEGLGEVNGLSFEALRDLACTLDLAGRPSEALEVGEEAMVMSESPGLSAPSASLRTLLMRLHMSAEPPNPMRVVELGEGLVLDGEGPRDAAAALDALTQAYDALGQPQDARVTFDRFSPSASARGSDDDPDVSGPGAPPGQGQVGAPAESP